ncbi:hypothetical protein EKO04_008546 [Ascochyta lentis]|uniref:SnoaL-like domain-containing protein n=1 Tax=Ascochyta lentis TaxID=205686 RepID=A0A8H7IVK2_9PLEO|nr:hypothetical protein EKO04_008546 [Ascochyta lentis]
MSTSQELIRNTIAQVAIAINQKDWRSLETLFTSDAASTYPAPIGEHTSFRSFQKSLEGILKDISTQHSLTTQFINVDDSAMVTTYVTTVAAGAGGGATHTSSGVYKDELIMVEFDGQERWLLVKRIASTFP